MRKEPNQKSIYGVAVGTAIAFGHFASYLACICAVVANDSVGDQNSTVLSVAISILGMPLMPFSGMLMHALGSIGLSGEGRYAGIVCLAALNSVLWAWGFLWGLGLARAGKKAPVQPPVPTRGNET